MTVKNSTPMSQDVCMTLTSVDTIAPFHTGVYAEYNGITLVSPLLLLSPNVYTNLSRALTVHIFMFSS